MAKAKKDQTADLKVGALVRYKKPLEAAEPSEVLEENDLIKITEVPENYLDGWIKGEVVERGGEPLDELLEDYFTFQEVEIVGTHKDWVDAQPKNSNKKAAVKEPEAPVEEEPKVKKEKKAKATKQEVAVVEPVAKGQLVPKSANDLMTYLKRTDLHEAALELAELHYKSDTILAAVLTEIYDQRIYEQYVNDQGEENNFQTYIEEYFSQSIHYRKALYLVNSFKFLKEEDIDVTYMQDVGYAKIQKLIDLRKKLKTPQGQLLLDADPDIMKDMIERAKSVGRDTLEDEITARVSSEMVGASAEQRKLHKVTLGMFDDDFTIFNEALAQYRDDNAGKVDGASDAQVLVAIIQEWQANAVGIIPSLEQDIENFEARHGVQIEVVPQVKRAK